MMPRSITCAVALALCGCHATTSSKPIVLSNGVAVRGKGFGDTLTFSPRIIAIDRIDERAAASLAAPGHVLLLGVIPGREIELIEPGDATTARKAVTGTIALAMRRYEVDPIAVAAIERRVTEAERRCESAARARQQAAERAAKNSQKRDSTGKIIGGSSGGASTDMSDPTFYLQSCIARDASSKEKPTLKRIAPRPASDRYLVMLVSSSPLKWDFLNERLATLTAVGADAATTIEAIAAGLYVGTEGKWAGYFVAW